MTSSAPTPEYGAPWIPVTSTPGLVAVPLGDYDDDYEATVAEVDADNRAYWRDQLGGNAEPLHG
jgi:hypothetical protein